MSSRTTLKTYFLSGATPTEAQFADLIDSVLVLSEDLVDDFSSTSATDALTANAGKLLNDSLTSIDSRVTTLESASTAYLASYYTKTEVDTSITNLGIQIDGKASSSSLNTLSSTVSGLQSDLTGKASSSHVHTASDISDLQGLLDAKASTSYVDTTKLYIEGLISAIDPGIDLSHLGDFAALAARVLVVENDYITVSQLAQKADSSHTHSVSQISDLDLSLYYNKASVDALLSNVQPAAHTHVESDITDLDKYTQAETNLQITDHSARVDNPHGVTKSQIGLADVANLSVAGIFQSSEAQLLATKAEVQALDSSTGIHALQKDNPHEVTKTQVNLGNVPNIDVNALLTAHLAADNPHNIDSSYLDVYTQAETQVKIEENYDAHRYSSKPTSNSDGGGAIGDIAYHASGLYFKFGATEWRQILTSTTFGDTSSLIETPLFKIKNGNNTLFEVDSSTDTTNINTSVTNIGGDSFSNFSVSDLFKITKTGSTSVTNIDTALVSLGGNLNVEGTLRVGLATTLASTLSAGATTVSSLSAGTGAISTTGTIGGGAITGTSLSAGTGSISTTGAIGGGAITGTSLSAGTGTISTTGSISGGAVTGTSLSAGTGTISTTGSIGGGAITGTSLSAGSGNIFTSGSASVGSLSSGAISGTNLTLSGDLTVNGTTTSIDTTNLTIEDNVVLLNKNQTGTPASNLQSGFEVERGSASNAKFYWDEASDTWKAIMQVAGAMVTKTVEFTDHTHGLSDITDSGTAAALNVPTSGNATTSQVVIGNDSRLTDSRNPKSHSHGNITNDGKVGAASNKPLITTTAGAVTTGSFGTTANSFCQGNDSRLSDARSPTSHSHAISDITELANTLAGKADSGSVPSVTSFLSKTEIEALMYSIPDTT